jgi:hypothetical protein
MSKNVIIQVTKSSKNEMGRVCGMHGAEEICLLDFDGETEGTSPCVITKGRCGGNIKMGVNNLDRRAGIALICKKIQANGRGGATVNTGTKLYTL